MVRRWVPLVLGGMWWWAVLRLALEPEHAGLVEGAVAAERVGTESAARPCGVRGAAGAGRR